MLHEKPRLAVINKKPLQRNPLEKTVARIIEKYLMLTPDQKVLIENLIDAFLRGGK